MAWYYKAKNVLKDDPDKWTECYLKYKWHRPSTLYDVCKLEAAKANASIIIALNELQRPTDDVMMEVSHDTWLLRLNVNPRDLP